MAYDINWSLIGAPAGSEIANAVNAGFETGMVRSAFADLATDPTSEGALSRLAMFNPAAAMQMRERGRQEQFRTAARSAFNTETGEVDPVAMRRAYVEAGDIGGAMDFERSRTATERTEQQLATERLRRVAGLLDDATDEASYAMARETAIAQLGADPSTIPETYDPAWVAQQRRVVAALSNQTEMTTFMRDAEAAGIRPGSDEFRTAFLNRYAAPPRIVMVNGVPTLVDPGGGSDAPPPPLTDEDFAGDEGGPSPAGSGGFPY